MTHDTQNDDGGPAFPCETYGLHNGKETTIPTNGMTLRDWFAGQAMLGLVYNAPVDVTNATLSECAYSIADAMLTARKQH